MQSFAGIVLDKKIDPHTTKQMIKIPDMQKKYHSGQAPLSGIVAKGTNLYIHRHFDTKLST